MPGGDTSNGQSGAVAPPSSTFHQITPPKYLDLKHSGEIAENWKLWKEKYNNYFVISRLDRETPEFQLAMLVVIRATLGSSQSERSTFCLDQSESSISPM